MHQTNGVSKTAESERHILRYLSVCHLVRLGLSEGPLPVIFFSCLHLPSASSGQQGQRQPLKRKTKQEKNIFIFKITFNNIVHYNIHLAMVKNSKRRKKSAYTKEKTKQARGQALLNKVLLHTFEISLCFGGIVYKLGPFVLQVLGSLDQISLVHVLQKTQKGKTIRWTLSILWCRLLPIEVDLYYKILYLRSSSPLRPCPQPLWPLWQPCQRR